MKIIWLLTLLLFSTLTNAEIEYPDCDKKLYESMPKSSEKLHVSENIDQDLYAEYLKKQPDNFKPNELRYRRREGIECKRIVRYNSVRYSCDPMPPLLDKTTCMELEPEPSRSEAQIKALHSRTFDKLPLDILARKVSRKELEELGKCLDKIRISRNEYRCIRYLVSDIFEVYTDLKGNILSIRFSSYSKVPSNWRKEFNFFKNAIRFEGVNFKAFQSYLDEYSTIEGGNRRLGRYYYEWNSSGLYVRTTTSNYNIDLIGATDLMGRLEGGYSIRGDVFDIHQKDNIGQNAMDYLLKFNSWHGGARTAKIQYWNVKKLVEAGADINHKNWDGNTFLMHFVSQAELPGYILLAYLVKFYKLGADFTIKNIEGKTVFDLGLHQESYEKAVAISECVDKGNRFKKCLNSIK